MGGTHARSSIGLGRMSIDDRAVPANSARGTTARNRGEKLMMKMVQVGVVGFIVALTVFPLPAMAYCACACINGKAQNVCSNAVQSECMVAA